MCSLSPSPAQPAGPLGQILCTLLGRARLCCRPGGGNQRRAVPRRQRSSAAPQNRRAWRRPADISQPKHPAKAASLTARCPGPGEGSTNVARGPNLLPHSTFLGSSSTRAGQEQVRPQQGLCAVPEQTELQWPLLRAAQGQHFPAPGTCARDQCSPQLAQCWDSPGQPQGRESCWQSPQQSILTKV